MTNNKAAKAGIGYVIGNYLLKGLQFFTIPIFSRLMSPADYGIYNTFVAYESIFFVIVGFAIHTSFKNAKYKYEEYYDEYVSSSLLLLIINFLLWFIILLCSSTFLVEILKLNRISLTMLLMYSFSSAVITCINSHLALNYQYKSFILISAINAISNILISIILINTAFSNETYLGRIIGTTLPAFLISIILVFIMFKNERPRNCKEYWKWGLGYSLPIVPHGISQVILNQFDRIMIQNMIGSIQAGIYSFAYNIYMIISVTTTSLGNAWEPWFYEKMNKQEYSEIRERSSQYVLGVLVFTIVVMLLSPEMIKILANKSYWDAQYSVLPIIAAGYYSFLYTLPSSVEYYYSKTKYIAFGTMFSAILNIVLNYIFILKFGYIAAAYTTLLTYFVYFIMHYYLSRKIFKGNIFDGKVLVFAITIIPLTILITTLFISNLFIRVILVIIVMICALIYENKNIGFIKRFISKKKGI